MSFFLTTSQMEAGTKSHTRRLNWRHARVGQVIQPIFKGQGLKKGEKVRKIARPIQFTEVRFEQLNTITKEDVVREGFPEMTPAEFVAMFCRHSQCDPSREITVIAFKPAAEVV
jgi:hypothetical protein